MEEKDDLNMDLEEFKAFCDSQEKKAMEQCVDYFKGEELPSNVFLSKYALRDTTSSLVEDNPRDMHNRLSEEFHRIDAKKFKNPYSEEEIFSYLDRFEKVIPQGSPMYGIGNPFQVVSLSNCYVVPPPEDSYGGICLTDQQLVQISKRRGGVGVDISKLRPEGSATNNAARTSTGIVPFLERFSNSIREVGQSGRRGALMVTLSVHHPEILNFISVKRDLSKVTGANISVRLTDEFLNAVKNDEVYELRWPVDARENGQEPEVSIKVQANLVWKAIVNSAHHMAEPGILFWDNIVKQSPADCYWEYGFRTNSTNPCSEIPLCSYDSCRLLVINLLSCIENPYTPNAYFNFDTLRDHSYFAQRMMDNLIDLEVECLNKIIKKIESDPEEVSIKRVELDLWKSIIDVCEKGRRTGTGMTALGDVMAAMGIRYASEESLDLSEKIYKTIKLSAYRCSVDMAKEIGPFQCYNAELEKDCLFIKRIAEEDPDLYADMVKYGRRNIALLTVAPTGSVSILTQTTAGIEPLFKTSYIRRKKINPNDSNTRVDFTDATGDKWQNFHVFHPRIKDWAKVNVESIVDFVKKQTGSDKIDFDLYDRYGNIIIENENVIKFVEKNNPWIGSCADELDWKERVELQSRIQRHCDHAISSTLNLPSDVSVEKVAEIYEKAWSSGCKGITVYRDGCRSGVLISSEDKKEEGFQDSGIEKTNSVKRPESLPAELHHMSVNKMRYYVAVGFKDKDPFEIFTGMNHDNDGEIIIPKSVLHGEIIKKARGKYSFKSDSGTEYHLTNGHSDPTADALTRSISLALRHGAGIQYVVHSLEKTKGDMTSFSKVMARALKKYIPDGVKVTGETVGNCETPERCTLVREEGCITCKTCGYSKCA